MSSSEIMQWAIGIYVDLAEIALPIAIAFGIGNLIVNIILGAAFGGRLDLSGGRR